MLDARVGSPNKSFLHELTDSDLEDLGLNLGGRKRLLKAIAALAAGPAQVRVETTERTAASAAPRDAERRQLTVMLVDLVGTTELSARLDPDDMSALIRTHQSTGSSFALRATSPGFFGGWRAGLFRLAAGARGRGGAGGLRWPSGGGGGGKGRRANR